MRRLERTALAVLAVPVLLVTRYAAAIPLCSSLPSPVYLQVDGTQAPLLNALGQKLGNSVVHPVTLVYLQSSSCTDVGALLAGTKITQDPSYVPTTAEDPSWTPDQPAPQCVIDPAGQPIDIAGSNVFVSACTSTAVPAGVGVFQGAIRPYVFVVPTASTEQAITAEEAYFVFGFGAAGQVTPWNDPTFLYTRSVTDSDMASFAASIDVPAAKWQGTVLASSPAIVSALATSTSPAKTMATLPTDIYDQNRSTMNALAFRTFHQNYAYYPDSSPGVRDKRNVRDGHYVVWSPTFYLTAVDGSGTPVSTDAGYVIDLLTNGVATPTPDFDPLLSVVSVGLVPDCAMRVTRSVEGGDLSLYSPAAPCGCFFESAIAVAPASCVACTTDATCNGGKCRHGYCEAK